MSRVGESEQDLKRGQGSWQGAGIGAAIAALCLTLSLVPLATAKAPGLTHCYNDICRRVLTVAETTALIGASRRMATSYYDNPALDPFNPGGFTSSGELFDAASPLRVSSSTYPDGTELLIRNPINGRASHVRVNDFGPFHSDREVDVTRRVADDLGFQKAGLAVLDVIVIAAPLPSDLKYLKNRSLPPTRGYLGVIDQLEMKKLVADLIGLPGGVGTAKAGASPGPWLAAAGAGKGKPADETAMTQNRGVGVAHVEAGDVAAKGSIPSVASGEASPAKPPEQIAVASKDREPTSALAAPATPPAEERIIVATLPPVAAIEGANEQSRLDASETGNGPKAPPADAFAEPVAPARPQRLAMHAHGKRLTPRTSTKTPAPVANYPQRGDDMPLAAMIAGIASLLLAMTATAVLLRRPRTAPASLPSLRRVQRNTSENFAPLRSPTGGQRTAAAVAPGIASETNLAGTNSGGIYEGRAIASSNSNSYLGPDLVIVGDVAGSGHIQLASHMTGSITAERITLLEAAVVDGRVRANHVDVHGRFDGIMIARELTLHDTARVSGTLIAGAVATSPAAVVEAEFKPSAFDLPSVPPG